MSVPMAAAWIPKLLTSLLVASSIANGLSAGTADGYRPGNCHSNSSLACDPKAECVDSNDGQSFTCKCQIDTQGDGFKAEVQGTGCKVKTQEETEPSHCSRNEDCHHLAVCNLTLFKCVCRQGFQGDGHNCTDIDECLYAKCDRNAVCRNFPGGYNCTCDDSRNYVWDGASCVLFCYSDNNCDMPRARCNASNSCECVPGYEGSGVECNDIDECAKWETNNCSNDADCINNNGSYTCRCKNGYSGDGYNCILRAQKCDQIKDFKPGQKYEIDPDGTGPANVIWVTCDVFAYSIITVIPTLTKFPVAAPKDDSVLTINYGADPSDMGVLARRSEYSYQVVSFSCYPGVALFPGTSWCGPSLEFQETWGSNSQGKCACGAVKSCPSSCFCDGNQTEAMVTDDGRIVDKNNLPVIKVRFTQAQKDKGRVTFGPLICSDNPIDIPRDCHEAKYKFKITKSGPQHIDPDGRGGNQPVLVFCDMTSFPHTGVTHIAPRRDVVTLTASNGEIVDYDVSLPTIRALIDLSAFCSQYVELQCRNSRISSGGAFVNVTSSNHRLGYFPGGDDVLESCACGSTHSCQDPDVKCNCDIIDDNYRKDFGFIINTQHLPVVGVTAAAGVNSSRVFKIGPLRCSQYQFGIEPNCEKYRALGASDNYTYLVDPDGVGGVDPFKVECQFLVNPPKGITIVHHTSEKPAVVVSESVVPDYWHASPAQIEALKNRSSSCTQEITFNCYRFSMPTSQDAPTWTGADDDQYSVLEYLASCGPARDKCNCRQSERQRDSGVINDTAKLPVYQIDFPAVRGPSYRKGKLFVTLGPLVCAEVFATCAIMQKQLRGGKAVEGETSVVNGYYTIDPDGQGGMQEFPVFCDFPATIVDIENRIGGLFPDPGTSGTTSACFDLRYTGGNDAAVSSAQVSALVLRSRECRQDVVLECQNAPATNRVNYTTCDGKLQKGWVGSYGEDKCACGVNGNCAGGRHANCNCDMADSTARSDSGSIIKHFMPVCQVCLAVNPNDPTDGSSSAKPQLKFKVSKLRCDTDPGTRRTCQDGRQKAGVSVKTAQETPISINKDEPVLVGCTFNAYPPTGFLILKVVWPVTYPCTQGDTEIQVDYITHSFTQVTSTFKDYEYCIQSVYIFNAAPGSLDMRGAWGFYNTDGHKLVDVREGDETSDAFLKARNEYSELFEKYGSPNVFTMASKEELPVTRVVLSGCGSVVVVGDVQCVDLKKTCQEILDTNSRYTGHISGRQYVIDPDGASKSVPFVVACDFDEKNKNGVTEVLADNPWPAPVTVVGKKRPASHTVDVRYIDATYQQISALANVSGFCWQGILWQSRYSPLVSRTDPPSCYYNLYGHGPSRSFGTGSNFSVTGCACFLTGTCVSDYHCNGDALRSMDIDQGVVTDKYKLPITSVVIGGQLKQNSLAKIQLTSVRCSSWSFDLPGDCSEADKLGKRFGFNTIYSSEFPLSADPRNVDPFIARCEVNPTSNTAMAVIKVAEPFIVHLYEAAGATADFEYMGAELEQLTALVRRSNYCCQGVIFECIGNSSSTENTTEVSQTPLHFWGDGKSSGDGLRWTCPCGQLESCGGLDSSRKQKLRYCNCDVGGGDTRSDAGIVCNKEFLPLQKFVVPKNAPFKEAIIIVGDLHCSQSPISLNPCELGFSDCHEKATCVAQGQDYRCVCADGWNGKGVVVNSRQARANGRECIDDNECVGLNSCPYTATCVNTPGSYYCTCKPGYLQTGPISCQDINECANSTLSNCDRNAHCENLDGSYRCICNRRYQGDGHTCTPVGECLCFGDTHCITYDDRWLDVQGIHEYVLSQDGCSPGQPQSFRIHIETWKKNATWPGHYSYIKSLIIYGLKVIRLDQGGHIIVDGSEVRNYKEKHRLTVRNVRGNVELKTVSGLKVLWDGKDIVQVFVPHFPNNSLCGICGSYNNKPEDDTVVGPGCPLTSGNLTNNEALFSESWIVEGSSESVNCSPDQPEQLDDLCFYSQHFIRAEIHHLLGHKKSPFKECLKQKTPTHLKMLRKKFEYDLCHAQEDLDKEVCRLAEILAWDCWENEKINVSNWSSYTRVCEEKPTCPNNMVHRTSPKATLPVRTCDSDNITEAIDVNQECFCQQGQILEDDRCITPEECGCFYNNGYLAMGDVTTQADCSKIECLGKNITNKIPAELNKNEECAMKKGLMVIRCVDGYIRDKNSTCIRDKCYGVKCTVPNMVCVDGSCVCKSGYVYECNQCKDIDECVTGIAHCERIGQTCVNTEGSFACQCELGYKYKGQYCEDINECDYAVSSCEANSECVNEPGTYHCECCSGYTKSQNGTCQRDESIGQITKKCCVCHGKKCEEYGVVCGTDGKSYPSYRSLYVAACRANNDQLKVNYKGSCKEKCQQVTCGRHYAVCEEVGAVPQCKCPTCKNSTFTRQSQMVCATNQITYNSKCQMEAAVCNAELVTKVKVESIGKPCPPKVEDKNTPWGPWSACSERCKPGNKTRSRTIYNNITQSFVQETETETCYSTCAKGPCHPKLCRGPGQVCVVNKNNTASCQCPTCEDSKEELVCGQLGDVVQTFLHECDLQKTACNQSEPFYEVLERRACETKPVFCDVVRNFQLYTDENGCQSGSINFGKCDGGCDNGQSQCCIATEFAKKSAILDCPSGAAINKELSVITKCGCVASPAVVENDQ